MIHYERVDVSRPGFGRRMLAVTALVKTAQCGQRSNDYSIYSSCSSNSIGKKGKASNPINLDKASNPHNRCK